MAQAVEHLHSKAGSPEFKASTIKKRKVKICINIRSSQASKQTKLTMSGKLPFFLWWLLD
jgi:hypothetical protein